MAASQTGILRILDCSRGLSDYYPPRIDDDQLAEAWNVEFWDGSVCGRRWGCAMQIGGVTGTVGYSLFVHTPTTLRTDDRLAVAVRADGLGFVNFYDAAWAGNSIGVDNLPDFTKGVDWATLHGKLFLATKSAVNRLHVYSPSWGGFRATGIKSPPVAPVCTIRDTGTMVDNRQFRVRYARIVSGVTVLRSEPSAATLVTVPPSGISHIQVDLPVDATREPWVTHWEAEEISGGSWYRIAVSPVSMALINTAFTLAQVAAFPLSEDVGDYVPQYSAQWLTVDEDRLILGGSHDEEAKSARVSWTPIGIGNGNGQVGVGNDERLPADVDGYLDFDMLDGGGITGLKAWDGKVIVFKRSQVHQMVRNSSRLRAYLSDNLSRRHGAIPHSIVEGTDEDGLSCLYFLDPEVGPMQLGFKGLRVLAPQLQRTWRTSINLEAPSLANIASVTYHAEKRQVWWHIATNGNVYQNVRWMYSCESGGVVRHTTPKSIKSSTSWLRKPTMLYDPTVPFPTFIGQGDWAGNVWDYSSTLGTYRAYIVTKAYQLGQLLRRFQIDSAVLEANAYPIQEGDEPDFVHITCRRDFGLESRSVKVTLSKPDDGPLIVYPQEWMVVPVDNSYMTEAMTMQFEIGDISEERTDKAYWQIHGLTLAWSLGSPTTGRG